MACRIFYRQGEELSADRAEQASIQFAGLPFDARVRDILDCKIDGNNQLRRGCWPERQKWAGLAIAAFIGAVVGFGHYERQMNDDLIGQRVARHFQFGAKLSAVPRRSGENVVVFRPTPDIQSLIPSPDVYQLERRYEHGHALSVSTLSKSVFHVGSWIDVEVREIEVWRHFPWKRGRGAYLLRYAQEATWREDNRREANGTQVQRLAELAMKRKPSVDFSGYWQRHTN